MAYIIIIIESSTQSLFSVKHLISLIHDEPAIIFVVLVTKFIILIPSQLPLLTLREEFLDFCDQLNIDAILEPVKR